VKKKKSELRVFPTSPTQPENKTISTPPKASTNIALGIDDLIEKAAKLSEKSTIIPELGEITEADIWSKICENFKGSLSEKQLVLSLKPRIELDTFIFTVESENYGKMVEEQFHNLSKIYTQVTSKLANFSCIVDTSNIVIDLTKKQTFEELAEKYPILFQINEMFRLDFNG
jgi:phage I-like protein